MSEVPYDNHYPEAEDTLQEPSEGLEHENVEPPVQETDNPNAKSAWDDDLEAARLRDALILNIVLQYKDDPSMLVRTKRFYKPTDQTDLSTDPERRYFQDARRYRLLSADEERDLLAGIDEAVALYEQTGVIAPDDINEREIYLRATAAYEMLILSNLLFVAKIAHNYVGFSTMPLPDLLKEGVIGLSKAIRRFDSKRNHRLLTVAAWWVRSAISRAIIDRGHHVRIPVYTAGKMVRLQHETRILAESLGHDPTTEELIGALMNPEEIAEMQRLKDLDPEFLGTPIGGGAMRTDFLAAPDDNHARGQDEQRQEQHRLIQSLIDRSPLTSREREVLQLRLGLGANPAEPQTYRAIGKQLQVSPETVRKTELRAIEKMRKQYASQLNEGINPPDC